MTRGWRRLHILVLVVAGALTSGWNATQTDKLRVTEFQLVASSSKMTYYGSEL
jgi:hypothetical protein